VLRISAADLRTFLACHRNPDPTRIRSSEPSGYHPEDGSLKPGRLTVGPRLEQSSAGSWARAIFKIGRILRAQAQFFPGGGGGLGDSRVGAMRIGLSVLEAARSAPDQSMPAVMTGECMGRRGTVLRSASLGAALSLAMSGERTSASGSPRVLRPGGDGAHGRCQRVSAPRRCVFVSAVGRGTSAGARILMR
jgi:hypothetical protein